MLIKKVSLPADQDNAEKRIVLDAGMPLDTTLTTVTPFLVDHSAYDAYSIMVEAGGRKIFYTGDLRAHGRKGRFFERLTNKPPSVVDVLFMEGTTINDERKIRNF